MGYTVPLCAAGNLGDIYPESPGFALEGFLLGRRTHKAKPGHSSRLQACTLAVPFPAIDSKECVFAMNTLAKSKFIQTGPDCPCVGECQACGSIAITQTCFKKTNLGRLAHERHGVVPPSMLS